ncbi:MAG: class I SAM-dependent methyltransferase [Alphaproteobacteria bacterium]|nr:class I SAM-dependent methyltransferase [Alphaproteobacteria bacterium]
MTANPAQLFDRNLMAKRQTRFHSHRYDVSFLLDFSEKEMRSRLELIKKKFPIALQIGGNTPLSDNILTSHKIERFFTLNLTSSTNSSIVADEELFPFANKSLNLVLSHLQLHTINDVPGTLIQIKNSLAPNGLFMASLCGNDTLFELRDALAQAEMAIKGGLSPRIYPFADIRQIGALIQRAGFALPVIDIERVTVTYDHMLRLLKDLQHMGQSNALLQRPRSLLRRDIIERTQEIYLEKYSDPDGRLRASFDIIFMLGWAPHESQQQPLKPGSAKTRLADTLCAKEEKLPC